MQSILRSHQIQSFFGADDFERQALEHAERERRRAESELALLAAICSCGLRGMSLAIAAGVTFDTFRQTDTDAIWTALCVAGEGGWLNDREHTFRTCCKSLTLFSVFDDDDLRSFTPGMVVGPGPLAHLFTAVNPDTAVTLIPILAAALNGGTR